MCHDVIAECQLHGNRFNSVPDLNSHKNNQHSNPHLVFISRDTGTLYKEEREIIDSDSHHPFAHARGDYTLNHVSDKR